MSTRRLEVEERRVGAKEHTVGGHLREQARDPTHAFEHGNLDIDFSRRHEIEQRLSAKFAQRVQEHQPESGRVL